MLSSALFSSAQARVLAWLFGQPERWFHFNELLRLTGLGSASLQRELARLDAGGLVVAEQVGNLRRRRANERSPVYTELVSLVRKTVGVVPALREALRPLRKLIELALVFGSVAKQTDGARSDLDLLVVSDTVGVGEILPLVLDAEVALGRKVNPTCYTSSEFERRRSDPDSFVNRVLAQPTLVLWGEVHEPVATG
ncbi:MAG: nucleotidyltransferase domain-containing protein [Burkholderiaceae bacterium]